MGISAHSKPFWAVLRRCEALLLVCLILLGLHSIGMIVAGHFLESKVSQLRSAGQPVSCTACAPAPVPADRNAASVYATAFRRLDAEGFQAPRNAAAEMSITELPDARPHQNGGQVRTEATRRLAHYRDIAGLVSQAESRPSCRFPVRWEDGAMALLPHEAKLREIERILCADAVVSAEKGEAASAMGYLKLAVRLHRSLETEPCVISQLVRMALVGISLNTLDDLATPANASSPQGREIANELGGIDLGSAFLPAEQFERAVGIEVFQGLRSSGKSHGDALAELSTGERSDLNAAWIGSYAWRPMLYVDQLAYLNHMDREIAAAAVPWRLRATSDAAFDRATPRYDMLTRLLTPSFTTIAWKRDLLSSRIAGSRLLLAILRYRAETGAYPSSLRGLPGTSDAEPIDPFSGKPFIYHRSARGFTLTADTTGMPERPESSADERGPHAAIKLHLTWQRDS
ncbi:MAG: hypothetical protein LC772_07965 [Chloroflexi bacterium]|nr:hypothetical protein [Chloroflexota bacterium]